jgi:hypothetical protein
MNINPHGKACECDYCFDNGFGRIQYIYDDDDSISGDLMGDEK